MITLIKIDEVRALVKAARHDGKGIGFVPTMGALHAGHASLIEQAKRQSDFVVVSIFVNPTQFAPTEDLSAYPRTPQQDEQLCTSAGADAIFMPSVDEMYGSHGRDAHATQTQPVPMTSISVEALSQTLCGASRQGHFAGVCTVVAKLFNIVQPDKAFFGAKDFQQATIIRRMTADLNFPIEIVICPTVRESDGLAMSSRNRYLSPQERQQAAGLNQSLQLARKLILDSHPAAAEIIAAIVSHISQAVPLGVIDYVKIVDPNTLSDVQTTNEPVLIAIAVKVGKARLIDNIVVD